MKKYTAPDRCDACGNWLGDDCHSELIALRAKVAALEKENAALLNAFPEYGCTGHELREANADLAELQAERDELDRVLHGPPGQRTPMVARLEKELENWRRGTVPDDALEAAMRINWVEMVQRNAALEKVVEVWKKEHAQAHGNWLETRKTVATLSAQKAGLVDFLKSLLPTEKRVNERGVDWNIACGRYYLSVAGWSVAMEGDVSRDEKTPRCWDGPSIKEVVEHFNAQVLIALAAAAKEQE